MLLREMKRVFVPSLNHAGRIPPGSLVYLQPAPAAWTGNEGTASLKDMAIKVFDYLLAA